MHPHRDDLTRRPGPGRRGAPILLSLGLAAALVTSACRGDSASSATTLPCGSDSGAGCAPAAERVDLAEPSFSDPTTVSNPLLPVGEVTQALLLGNVDGDPLRVEVTLLPGTKIIDWNGRRVETLASQYVSYLGGRIHEVAIDWYAQADDGSVWYFGEDVSNFQDGRIADTEGTWLAGQDGPAGMIMPANPQVGDVYRPENIPGLVFEEATVKSTGKTAGGPHGPVGGTVVVEELHMDGTLEDKTFAPGYGEFSTGAAGGDLEAAALAVPTDALPGPPPAELQALSTGAADLFGAAQSEDWSAVSATFQAMATAWGTYQAGDVPELLDAQMSDALDALTGAVDARDSASAHQATIDVARAGLDLQLRHRPPAEIDLARFDLWARQLVVDSAAAETGAVLGDVVSLELIWDRVGHTVDTATAERVDAQLADLRAAADAEDFAAIAEAVPAPSKTLVS